MRLGFVLPHLGSAASPDGIREIAQGAEKLGYDSLWTTERVLYPVNPQSPYPGTPDGSLPEAFKINLDPIETLTFVAANTSRIALGTSVLDMPYYNPVMLARRLTTLDVLSGGRLRLGLGLGWSKDEYQATGAPAKGLGRYADEFVAVLKEIWTTDPVEFDGEFFRIPKSNIQPKPVQKPHPPIYLAAYTPAGLQRAATLADGWNPAGLPGDAMKQMMEGLKGMNEQAQVVVRANVSISEQPMGDERFIFYGSLDEIKADVAATQEMGADELFFDVTFSPDGTSVEGFRKRMEQLKELT